jgi:hypothetical protein
MAVIFQTILEIVALVLLMVWFVPSWLGSEASDSNVMSSPLQEGSIGMTRNSDRIHILMKEIGKPEGEKPNER